MTRHPLYGVGLALFGVLVIAPDTLLMRWSGLGPFQMMAWRGLLMGLALCAAWGLVSPGHRREFRILATAPGIGAVALQAANGMLFATGVGLAPVAVVLTAVATAPVWAAILGAAVLGERIGRATLATSAVVLLGIALSASGGHPMGAGDPVIGALAGLGVALALSASFITYRAVQTIPILLTVGLGAFLAGGTGVVLSGGDIAESGGALWAIAIAGLVVLPVSFAALSFAARYTLAANVSLIMLLETVLGPLIVWAGTGERVPPMGLAGGAVVVTALAIYLGHQRRRVRGSSA